jgi:crotonobetainyl-CoA:carnitine CoA-transferase CaiB-like acyl-CoA transferase
MGSVAPLTGLQVIDTGFGHAAALVSKFLAEAGATVTRLEPLAGDPFGDIYPAYDLWRETLAEVAPVDRTRFRRLIETADILVSGGERIAGASYGDVFDGIDLPERLIRLDIAPGLPGGPFAACNGADLLIQAETGIVFETVAERPAPMAISPSAYGAVFQSLTGLCAALLMREHSGRGQIVRVGLAEAAITMMAPLWSSADTEQPWFHFRVPKAARPLIFECADGGLIHVVLGSVGSKYKLYKLLGIDDPSVLPTDAGLPNPANPPEHFFGNIDLLAPRAFEWRAAELLDALAAAGIVAGRVLAPGDIWDHAQVIHNGIIGTARDGSRFVGQPVRWAEAACRPATVTAAGEKGPLPLSGLKVVDFGGFVAGPAASVGLADLGAEVIKVEPIGGDTLRPAYPFFAAANRGKKSIALDLKSPEGLRIAGQLARAADVVCSNFKAGVAERLGIDPTTLHEANGRAIVLLNSGYGLTGPLASAPAFDPVMQAECGLESRSGGEGNTPILNPAVLADFSGGYLGQIGVLMALFHRARHGRGMAIEVPLLNAALFLVADVVERPDGTHRGPLALSNDRTGFHPTERLYRAQDGWVAVSARTDAQVQALTNILGLDAAIDLRHRRWAEAELRAAERWFASFTVKRLLEILGETGVPAARCNPAGREAALESDVLVAQGTIFAAQRPKLGNVRGCGIGYRLSDVAVQPVGSLAGVSQHGSAILADLGYAPAQVARIQAEGIAQIA